MTDRNCPGSNFYDASFAEWLLDRDEEGKLYWRGNGPWKRKSVPLSLSGKELDLIPICLVELARATGLASTLGFDLGSVKKTFEPIAPTVLTPEQDHRLQGEKLTIPCPLLPPGVFVLLQEDEFTGLLVDFGSDFKDNERFGLAVWGLPRAIVLAPEGFTGRVGNSIRVWEP